jgi:hypothetical protein
VKFNFVDQVSDISFLAKALHQEVINFVYLFGVSCCKMNRQKYILFQTYPVLLII